MTVTPSQPTQGNQSLAALARDARMQLHELRSQRERESEQVALNSAGRRIEELLGQLAALSACESQLRDLGLTITFAKPPDTANARSQLRRLATTVEDPKINLAERFRGDTFNKALDAAKNLVSARTRAMHAAVDQERARLRPADLDQQTVSIPGKERLATTIEIIRRAFNDKSASKGVELLPQLVMDLRAHAERWQEIGAQIQGYVTTLQPEVRGFLEAANAGGAEWAKVTPAVRAWLDSNDNGDGFKVQKW